MARALGLGNDQLLPEGHQRENGEKGVREKVDATFAGITVQPMRQSHEATIQ